MREQHTMLNLDSCSGWGHLERINASNFLKIFIYFVVETGPNCG